MKIGIIGGGFSGLLVAYRLSQKNIPCVVFEQESLTGGRFQYGVKGITPSLHPRFNALLKEMGIESALVPLSGDDLGMITGDNVLNFSDLPVMVASFSQSDQEEFRKATEDAMRLDIYNLEANKKLREMSMQEYVQNFSPNFISNVINPIQDYTFMYPVDLSKISAEEGLFHLRIGLEFSSPGAKTFGKDEGVKVVTNILEKMLRDKNVEFHLSTEVKKIETGEKKAIISEKDGNRFSAEVDKIVFATPLNKVKKIAPEINIGEGIFYEKTKCFFVEGKKKTTKKIILGLPDIGDHNIRLYFDTYHTEQQVFPMNIEKEVKLDLLFDDYRITGDKEVESPFPVSSKNAVAPETVLGDGIYLCGDYAHLSYIEMALQDAEKVVDLILRNSNN